MARDGEEVCVCVCMCVCVRERDTQKDREMRKPAKIIR